MIDYDHFHVLNYVKKEEYTGSMNGMRYMLKKKVVPRDDQEETCLEVIRRRKGIPSGRRILTGWLTRPCSDSLSASGEL